MIKLIPKYQKPPSPLRRISNTDERSDHHLPVMPIKEDLSYNPIKDWAVNHKESYITQGPHTKLPDNKGQVKARSSAEKAQQLKKEEEALNTVNAVSQFLRPSTYVSFTRGNWNLDRTPEEEVAATAFDVLSPFLLSKGTQLISKGFKQASRNYGNMSGVIRVPKESIHKAIATQEQRANLLLNSNVNTQERIPITTDKTISIPNNLTERLNTTYYPRYRNEGAGGKRGMVFNQESYNQDKEVLNLLKEQDELSNKVFGWGSKESQEIQRITDVAIARDKANGIDINNQGYNIGFTNDEIKEIERLGQQEQINNASKKDRIIQINERLRDLEHNPRFYQEAEEAPNFIGKDWNETIEYANEHPEYIIDTWKGRNKKTFSNIFYREAPTTVKTQQDMDNYLKWYEGDVYPRIINASSDIGEFKNMEQLKSSFDNLVLKIVDIPKTDLGGWANKDEVKVIANEFGMDSSTFIHELHHYLRTKLENPIFRKSSGKQQPTDISLAIARGTEDIKGTGYTNKEANILDDAYEFLQEYIDKTGLSSIREKGATNTELRYNIAKAYAKNGIPARGKELDKVIDNLSDEELFNFMFRTNNQGVSQPMNGYMKNFMDNQYTKFEREDVILPNGNTHYQTPITLKYMKEKLPAIRKALKYVGGVAPIVIGTEAAFTNNQRREK